MGLFKKKSVRPLLLIATRKAEVLEIVPADTFQVREAFSTCGVLTALQASPRLMIVDLDDLVEVSGLSRTVLRDTLNAAVEDGIPLFSSEQFLSEGQQILGQSLSGNDVRTAIRFMPPRVVLIANYCGGVGKTTIALAAARRFHQAAGLGTALVEAGNLIIASEEPVATMDWGLNVIYTRTNPGAILLGEIVSRGEAMQYLKAANLGRRAFHHSRGRCAHRPGTFRAVGLRRSTRLGAERCPAYDNCW